MKIKLITLLVFLGIISNIFGASTMTPDLSGIPTIENTVSNNTEIISNLVVDVLPVMIDNIDTKVSSNDLKSVVLGSEGIRIIGALGGYTLEEFIEDTATRGPARDLPLFVFNSTNLIVTWSDGDIYDPPIGYFHLNSGTKTLTDNAVNYAYWSTNDTVLIQWTTGNRPTADNIYLGTFIASQGKIIYQATTVPVGDALGYEDVAFANIFPSLIINGMIISPNGTGLTNLTFQGGIEYHNMADRVIHNTFDMNITNSLVIKSHVGGDWASVHTNLFPIGLWDNGTNLVNCDTSKWYRGVFVSIANSTNLTWIAPDYEYTNDTDAIAGNDPDLPPAFTPYIPKVTAYVFKGLDTELRTDSIYWLDRRNSDNLLKSTSTGSSGGGANTPTLEQVLTAGPATGGILPTGMGNPTTDDQAASKGYVDSTRNKASTGTVYVDPVNGDDITGRVEKGSLPFKTIQAAIDACAVVATTDRRFLVSVSIGVYTEDITMKPFISLRGMDIESTIIYGQVTYPATYIDPIGTEVQVLMVKNTNAAPAIVISAGSDDSYIGFRSCYLSSTYSADAAVKSVIQIERGNVDIYATTWSELILSDVAAKRPAAIYYLTSNTSNSGKYYVNSFSSSHTMNILDTNDTVMIVFCTATNGGFFATKGDATVIYLDDSTNHGNRVTSVANKNTIDTRTFVESSIMDIRLSLTNSCDVIAASSTGCVSSVAHFNNSRMVVPNIINGSLFYGSSANSGDAVEVINSQLGVSSGSYPDKYTEAGSSGTISYNLQHGVGQLLIGGGLDLSSDNPSSLTPRSGHGSIYVQTTSGFENLYFIDSSGLSLRNFRDSSRTMYNAETTTLVRGETVYIPLGISGTANYCKRAKADSLTTMPCVGFVASTSIVAGAKGRIFFDGRIETGVDTSYMTAGQPVYLSAVNGGGFTNVAPSSGYAQRVGYANVIGVNGSILISIGNLDILGNKVPTDYATYSQPVFASSAFALTDSGVGKFSTADIPAGTTNTYILPAVGGQLATYTDIELVPIAVVVGETNGIEKGRVVYQTATVSGGRPVVKYSDRRDSTTLPVVGVTTASGNLGDIIEVASFGPVTFIDTSMFNPGDMVYLGTNGMLSVASTVPTDAIIMMGTCMLSSNTAGSILVNIRSYYMDGAFNGSMRYTVKNASSESNATAAVYAINDIGEAIRMVVRGSGNTRGPATLISCSANGPTIFGNTRRKPYIWDIDMTDSGTDYTHLQWPMMALVPQAATSNAFLGIGTTNPLTMLDVIGGITGSNGFRRATGAYANNEWMTYGDIVDLDIALSNSLVGVMNSKDTVISNAFGSADTSLSNSLVGVMNSKDTVISNAFVSADTSLSNSLVGVINAKDTIISNAFGAADVTLSNSLVGVMNGKDTVISNAFVAADTVISNAFGSADTSLSNSLVGVMNTKDTVISNAFVAADGVLTNRIGALEARSNAWNNVATSRKFYATCGAQTFGNGTTDKVNYTNSVLNVGGTYTAASARWTPEVNNVMVRIQGNLNVDVGNNSIVNVYIYKNGGQKCTVFAKRTTNAGEELANSYSFVDITTNAADYYEVYGNIAGGGAMLNGQNGNWWSGQVVY